MKYLKGCDSSQYVQRFVAAVVHSAVRIFVEYIKDGDQEILAQVSIGIFSKDNRAVEQSFTFYCWLFASIRDETFLCYFEVFIARLAELIDVVR